MILAKPITTAENSNLPRIMAPIFTQSRLPGAEAEMIPTEMPTVLRALANSNRLSSSP
jgi:hypothetical protein